MEEYLRTAVEQLRKKEIINQIDQQITELVQMPEELEEAVCEVEELQDSILEKIIELKPRNWLASPHSTVLRM